MLIIFDLDDTLIDTTGCITHFKLEDALKKMLNAGLVLRDYDNALDLLRRLNRTSESAASALSEFIEITGADKNFFEVGFKEIYDTPFADLCIFPLEGALDLLINLGQHHQLALVSIGKTDLQMEKLKKAGIDTRLFSKITVTEEKNKKPHYQIIVDELGYRPNEVLVCGDRILVDLTPARELGFKTIQIKWGRGLNSIRQREDVDYCISEIGMLKGIVDDLMTFSSI